MIFCQNRKFLKAYNLVLLFLRKINVFYFGRGSWHGDTFFASKLGRKMGIFRGFSKGFFTTTGFQLKFLILTEFPKHISFKTSKIIQSGCGLGAKLRPN